MAGVQPAACIPPLRCRTRAHTHTRTQTHSHSLSLSLSHTHTHTRARAHTHTHTHTTRICLHDQEASISPCTPLCSIGMGGKKPSRRKSSNTALMMCVIRSSQKPSVLETQAESDIEGERERERERETLVREVCVCVCVEHTPRLSNGGGRVEKERRGSIRICDL